MHTKELEKGGAWWWEYEDSVDNWDGSVAVGVRVVVGSIQLDLAVREF